jgi:hypothetical protein
MSAKNVNVSTKIPSETTSASDRIKPHLRWSDRFGLRLTKIFCAAGQVVHEDLKIHPWKLVTLFTPFPLDLTLTIIGTLAYFALGVTKRGREGRSKIAKSFTEAVDYAAYKHFFYTEKKERKFKRIEIKHHTDPETGKITIDWPQQSHFGFCKPTSHPNMIDDITTQKNLRVNWSMVRSTLHWNAKIAALNTVRDWLAVKSGVQDHRELVQEETGHKTEASTLKGGKRLALYMQRQAERKMITAKNNYPAQIIRRRSYCKNPAL